jgi:EAL domain-containing protein (putative c-di-GMP-specific phosphodiesterase class I)
MLMQKVRQIQSPIILAIFLCLLFTLAITFSLIYIGQKISEDRSLEYIEKRGEAVVSTIDNRINNVLSHSYGAKIGYAEYVQAHNSISAEKLVEIAVKNLPGENVNIDVSINDESVYFKDNLLVSRDVAELMIQRSVDTNGAISSISLYKNKSKDNVFIEITTLIDSLRGRNAKLSIGFWLFKEVASAHNSSVLVVNVKNSGLTHIYGSINGDDADKIITSSFTGNEFLGYSIFRATVVNDVDLIFVEKNNDFMIRHSGNFIAHVLICMLFVFLSFFFISKHYAHKILKSNVLLEKSISQMESNEFSISSIVEDGLINPRLSVLLSRHWNFIRQNISEDNFGNESNSSRNEVEYEKGLYAIGQYITSNGISNGNILLACFRVFYNLNGLQNAVELQRTMRDIIDRAVYSTGLNNGNFSSFMSDMSSEYFEFIVSVPNCSTARHLLRIIEAVESNIALEENKQFGNCAFGHSVYPNNGVTSRELVKNAMLSIGMQTNDSTFVEEKAKIALINLYFQSIDLSKNKSDISIFYHPIFDVSLRRIVGVEALVRFEISELGSVLPSNFIDIAMTNNKMFDIDMYVLTESCANLIMLKNSGIRSIGLSINLSSDTLRSEKCVERISSILTDTGFSPENLSAEISENIFLIDDEVIVKNIKSLKLLGIKIVVDNVYKNRSMIFSLRNFPIDYIKLNLGIIDLDEGIDQYNLVVIEGIIATSKRLNICTIVSGVESEAQYQSLKSVGCKMVQGFMLGKPFPAHRLADSVRTNLAEIYDFI